MGWKKHGHVVAISLLLCLSLVIGVSAAQGVTKTASLNLVDLMGNVKAADTPVLLFQVNDITDYSRYNPDVDYRPKDKQVVVVWEDTGADYTRTWTKIGAAPDIYYQCYSSSGFKVSGTANERITDDNLNKFPQLTDSGDYFIMSWSATDQNGIVYSDQSLLETCGPTPITLSSPKRYPNQAGIQAAYNPNTNYKHSLAVYRDSNTGHLKASFFDHMGDATRPIKFDNIKDLEITNYPISDPAVAFNPKTGKYLVVFGYSQKDAGTGTGHALGAVLIDQTTTVGTVYEIAVSSTDSFAEPRLIHNPTDDTFGLVYELQAPLFADSDIYLATIKVDKDVPAIEKTLALAEDPKVPESNPDITHNSNLNEYFTTWTVDAEKIAVKRLSSDLSKSSSEHFFSDSRDSRVTYGSDTKNYLLVFSNKAWKNIYLVPLAEDKITFSTAPAPPVVPTQTCGNDVREGTEECDGKDDTACPGKCFANCTCPTASKPTTPKPTQPAIQRFIPPKDPFTRDFVRKDPAGKVVDKSYATQQNIPTKLKHPTAGRRVDMTLRFEGGRIVDLSDFKIEANNHKTAADFSKVKAEVDVDHTLYVPKAGGLLYVCPKANSLAEVNRNCEDIFSWVPAYKTTSPHPVETETIDGTEYFKVSGLKSSGIANVLDHSLNIWDETDTSPKNVSENVTLYANFTYEGKTIPPSPAYCRIAFDPTFRKGGPDMDYDPATGLYTHTTSFNKNGTFSWNVECDDGILVTPTIPTIRAEDNLTIQGPIPEELAKITHADKVPEVKAWSPKDKKVYTTKRDVTFWCIGNDDSKLVSIELWTDISGAMKKEKAETVNDVFGKLKHKYESISDGSYTWKCKATDDAGNTSESKTRTLTINATKAKIPGVCTEDWECTPWSPLECEYPKVQYRQCRDLNDCGTTDDKPIKGRVCPGAPAEPTEAAPAGPGVSVTIGPTTGPAEPSEPKKPSYDWLWLVIGAVIILAAILLVWKRRKKKKPAVEVVEEPERPEKPGKTKKGKSPEK